MQPGRDRMRFSRLLHRQAQALRPGLVRAAALGAAVVGAVTAACAGERDVPAPTETVPKLGSCGFDFSTSVETTVHLVSSGSLRSEYRIPHSIARLGRHVVPVPKEASSTFVVLAGREPVHWDFHVAPGARIAGVLVLGLGHQVVTGVPAGTEVGFSILESDGSADEGPNCPHLSAARARFDLRSIEKLLIDEFGRPIDRAEVGAPLPCPYQECTTLGRPRPSLWQRIVDYWTAPGSPQATEVRASGRFIFRKALHCRSTTVCDDR